MKKNKLKLIKNEHFRLLSQDDLEVKNVHFNFSLNYKYF